ncbi:MAG: DUF411 domain-containing protein [Nitrososphaerota archaeon]
MSVISIVSVTLILVNQSPTIGQTQSGRGILFEVHRSPACSCCGQYEDYLRASGVIVRSVEMSEIVSFKDRLGIPREMWSCHTSIVEGYYVEGHVPLEAVEKLLDERPAIRGIALPSMPSGSPGMGGVRDKPLKVFSIDGGIEVFMIS